MHIDSIIKHEKCTESYQWLSVTIGALLHGSECQPTTVFVEPVDKVTEAFLRRIHEHKLIVPLRQFTADS